MSLLKVIEEECSQVFKEYIEDVLNLSHIPNKYFYLDKDYLLKLGEVNYNLLLLEKNDKYDELIQKAKNYFLDRSEHDISLDGVCLKLQDDRPKIDKVKALYANASMKYSPSKTRYISEYVYWKVLESENVDRRFVKQQKHNFLVVYIDYALSQSIQMFPSKIKRSFIKYTKLKEYSELVQQLDHIDREQGEKMNEELREKIDKLYVYEDAKDKLHFVFAIENSPENEELRKILALMQNPTVGKSENILYRGQANANWQLNSSLTRVPNFLENEAELYYEVLSLKPDAFEQDTSVYERLITMQHFGMPTRLMDLTRNPLIAIFFASNNKALENSDGAIFVFTPTNREISNFEDPVLDDLKDLFLSGSEEKETLCDLRYIRGVAKNQRVSNQSGDFIFVGKVDNPTQRLDDKVTKIIIIDSQVKKNALEMLRRLNIHGGSVYPDLTNMSNYIKDKYSS